MVEVNVKILENGKGLELPKYGTAQSAGADLVAAIDENITIEVGKRAMVSTGIAFALPGNFEAQVRPSEGSSGRWYRVIIGPYQSKRLAEKQRHTLQRAKINGCKIWLWNL